MPKAMSVGILKTKEFKSPGPGTSLPESRTLLLWIREEPFLFGVLPHSPKSIKIGVLRQAMLYMKEKGMYPYLTFAQWIHTSTAKMQMSRELSSTYFHLFHTLSRDFNEYKQKAKQTNTEVRKADYPLEEKINSAKFLLFLYIQNWTRLKKLRNPELDESWPKSNVPESELNTKSGRAKKLHWEIKCVNFMINHLIDILNFLSEGEQKGDRVRFDVIEALNLILTAADFHSKIEYLSLEKILEDGKTVAAIGYRTRDNSVDKIKFVRWVSTHLQTNPWSSGSTVFVKKDIEVSTGNCDYVLREDTNRVWHNNQNPPKLWCTISTVNDQVLFYNRFKDNSSLKIHRCFSSKLFIPGVFRYVTVEKCRNLEVFLGPVSRVLTLINCENVTFHAISRTFLLREVRNSQFYLVSPSQPIFCGGKNKNLKLAPYNTFYPKLEKDVSKIDISCSFDNLYNMPLDLGYDGQPVRNTQDSSYKLMKPDEFFEHVFPFKMSGETKANPFNLPAEYDEVVKLRKTPVAKFKEEVLNANLSDGVRSEFQQIVHIRFLSWLHLNGHDLLLKGLESLDEAERFSETDDTQVIQVYSPSDNAQGKIEEAITSMLKSLITGGSTLKHSVNVVENSAGRKKRNKLGNTDHSVSRESSQAKISDIRKKSPLIANFRSRLNAEIEGSKIKRCNDFQTTNASTSDDSNDCFT